MLIIRTHSLSPFSREFWKWIGRSITGKYSGPRAVSDSLSRGLTQLNVPHVVDPVFTKGDTVIVLSGVVALNKAIALKASGSIKQLVVGPNLVVTPHDEDGILFNSAIDQILVPSAWVLDYYRSISSQLASKTMVWPAGVAIATESSRDGNLIIYSKSGKKLCKETKRVLETSRLSFKIFEYGKFSHEDYLEALKTAPAVIYLSGSESQGLALQEAWMRNVPTFVHFTGFARTDDFEWRDEKINAPYLEDSFGSFYKDPSLLPTLLGRMSEYNPKVECEKKLSDEASASRLIKLIGFKY